MAKALESIGHGPFDQAIKEGFAGGLSAEAVSESIGNVLTPMECLVRAEKIVQAMDPLDNPTKLALLLDGQYYLRNRLKKQFEAKEYLDKDDVNSWLKTTEAIVKRIEAQSDSMAAQMMQVHEIHARVMVAAIRVSFDAALVELQKRYPEITQQEAFEVLEIAMPIAVKSLDAEVTSG